MLLTAVALSWWRTEHNRRIFERNLIEENGIESYFGQERYTGPAVLKKLIGLENLTDFYRRDSCVMYQPSPEAVERFLSLLRNIPRLRKFTVYKVVGLSDENLAEISHLKNLEELYLCDAKITDASMAVISGFSRLENLNVTNTKLTDASVPSLGRLCHLKVLDISSTKITPEGNKKLKALLPKCVILSHIYP
jgi:hypothetical protein